MKVHTEGNAVTVTVSRRNLEHLIAALDAAQGKLGPYLARRTESDQVLYIFAEEDSVHYAERHAGPGFERLVKDVTPKEEVA